MANPVVMPRRLPSAVCAMAATGIVLRTLGKDWKDKVELHPPYLPNPAGAGKPLAVVLGFFPPILTGLAFIAIWILITKHLR